MPNCIRCYRAYVTDDEVPGVIVGTPLRTISAEDVAELSVTRVPEEEPFSWQVTVPCCAAPGTPDEMTTCAVTVAPDQATAGASVSVDTVDVGAS